MRPGRRLATQFARNGLIPPRCCAQTSHPRGRLFPKLMFLGGSPSTALRGALATQPMTRTGSPSSTSRRSWCASRASMDRASSSWVPILPATATSTLADTKPSHHPHNRLPSRYLASPPSPMENRPNRQSRRPYHPPTSAPPSPRRPRRSRGLRLPPRHRDRPFPARQGNARRPTYARRRAGLHGGDAIGEER